MTEKTICILPTGDWAEINRDNGVQLITLDAKTFEALCNGDITAFNASDIAENGYTLADFMDDQTASA